VNGVVGIGEGIAQRQVGDELVVTFLDGGTAAREEPLGEQRRELARGAPQPDLQPALRHVSSP
jgi:hypothetical protein